MILSFLPSRLGKTNSYGISANTCRWGRVYSGRLKRIPKNLIRMQLFSNLNPTPVLNAFTKPGVSKGKALYSTTGVGAASFLSGTRKMNTRFEMSSANG